MHRHVPGFSARTITVTDAGRTLRRSFLIHVPLDAPRGVAPAVIAFHGGGQTAEDMVLHWKSIVSMGLGVVVVCPQALVDPDVDGTRWEIATPGAQAWPTTDLAFIDALLTSLVAREGVDPQRVYATGFSSGAGMTWQLSLHGDFVDRFRGFAPVSQALNSAMLALADADVWTIPKPLCYIHGTADDNWVRVHDGVLEPMPPDVVTAWLRRNYCLPAGPVRVYSCPAALPPDPTIGVFGVEQLYAPDPDAPASAAVCSITTVNAGHCYPLTGREPRGLVCRDFNASARMVSFWNRSEERRVGKECRSRWSPY